MINKVNSTDIPVETITISKKALLQDDGRPDVYKNSNGEYFRVIFRDPVDKIPNTRSVKAICQNIKDRAQSIFISPEPKTATMNLIEENVYIA